MSEVADSDKSDLVPVHSHGRRLMWGLVVAGLILGGIAWLGRDPVPEFQGRKLSERLADLVRPASSGSYQAASNAVVTLDDQALPVIVRELERPTPWHVDLFLQRQNKLPTKVRASLFRWLDPYQHSNRRLGAVRALEIVGTNAAPVAAELAVALGRVDEETAAQLAPALVRVGPAMVPHLKPYLTDPEMRKRSLAVFVLHQLGPESVSAAPELIAGLEGADQNHRRLVGQTLGRMGPSVLPQVTPLLASADPEVRLVAVRALNQLLPRARELTPQLMGLLDDLSPDVRIEVAGLLVNCWNLPAEEWRRHLRKLPAEHPTRARYGESLDAFEAGEARLLEVLREGLRVADPKRRLEAASRLMQLQRVDAEVVAVLQALQTNLNGSPWEMAGLTNRLNQAREQLTNATFSGPDQETSSRPDPVPAGQSPPSTDPPPAGKVP